MLGGSLPALGVCVVLGDPGGGDGGCGGGGGGGGGDGDGGGGYDCRPTYS